jgi:hypothetical protein
MEGAAIKKRMKISKFITILLITTAVLAGCSLLIIYQARKYTSNLDLESFLRKIEKYPMVEKIIFIEENELDFFNTINMGILIKDGGYIGINNVSVRLKCHKAFLTAIGHYRFYNDYYTGDLNLPIKDWPVSIRDAEELTGIPLRSLKDVLKNYREIISAMAHFDSERPE